MKKKKVVKKVAKKKVVKKIVKNENMIKDEGILSDNPPKGLV